MNEAIQRELGLSRFISRGVICNQFPAATPSREPYVKSTCRLDKGMGKGRGEFFANYGAMLAYTRSAAAAAATIAVTAATAATAAAATPRLEETAIGLPKNNSYDEFAHVYLFTPLSRST